MHLCFVDESGTPAKPGVLTPRYFVIAGLIIPEDRWHRISRQLQGAKTNSGYRGEVKWRYFAPGNAEVGNPMRDWRQDDRNKFRSMVFQILTGDRSIRVVAAVCDAPLAYKLATVNDQADIYFRTYKVVTERFQYTLQDISRESGNKVYGIIVADHRGAADDKRLREQHQRLIEQPGTFTSSYPNLIEGCFLTPSHMSVGVQFVDMIAGAVWRRFEHLDVTYFEQIRSLLRTSSKGAVDGFGIARFPKQGWQGPIIP